MNPLEQALNKKAGKAGDKKVSAKGMGGPDMSDPKDMTKLLSGRVRMEKLTKITPTV
jgi:hypothetical protein